MNTAIKILASVVLAECAVYGALLIWQTAFGMRVLGLV